MTATENWERSARLGGLRRFAIAITILNILGHTFFGFEQSWAHPLVALGAAYPLAILLEVVQCWSNGRKPAFSGSVRALIDFLLSAHISALAVAMLIYANDRLWVVAFATAVAIGSKVLFRQPARSGAGRHFYNPSNFGITVTLLLFSWVGIAPPYQFTENLDRIGDWLLPTAIICSGTFLNYRFTKRLPLIGAWLIGFVLQAAVRSLLFDAPLVAGLLPMTGVAFILYTAYMITDPATTPKGVLQQIVFGFSVAAVYGILLTAHVVFGLFFSLSIVCTIRGIFLYAQSWETNMAQERIAIRSQMKEV